MERTLEEAKEESDMEMAEIEESEEETERDTVSRRQRLKG